MIELVTREIEKVEAPVAQIERANATPVLAYNHELERIPYLYGVYGDKDGNEQQGLIKGSSGVLISELAEKYNNEEIKIGVIPDEARRDIDIHTIAIKDGNASVPVGIVGNGANWAFNEETGRFDDDENKVLWYGAATPIGLVWNIHNRALAYAQYQGKLAKEYADTLAYGGSAPIAQLPFVADNSRFAVYQDSEKNDEAVTLKFTDIENDALKKQYAKTYNRLTDTGVNALSLGSSIAMGKRSFAAGSSNIAAAEKAFATGCDCLAIGKQSFTAGYANAAAADSSAVLGSQSYAGGSASIATGLLTRANADYSFTAGNNTIASTACQFVCGKFNENKYNTVFEVGYGADGDNRANVFEVYANGDIGIGNVIFTQPELARLKEVLSSNE